MNAWAKVQIRAHPCKSVARNLKHQSPTRPTSPARTAAFDILLRVARENAYASELLHSSRYASLSSADHGLATELVLGVLRWRSRLDELIAKASFQPLHKLDPEVLESLRIAAYQVFFLQRIPAHAAINDSVELVKRARKKSAAPFVNAVLRKLSNKPAEPPVSLADPADTLAQNFAHPRWLVERWIAQYGAEATARICAYDQQPPPTAIRLRDPAAEQQLRDAGITLDPGALLSSARIVVSGDSTSTAPFREGRVVIQDEGSQLVAALVGHGARILDCCCAPGGKTSILADANPSSPVLALELHPHRARLTGKLVRQKNVRVISADARHLPVSVPFDRVLVDVPCSGTGTLARNPEIKWRLDGEDFGNGHSPNLSLAVERKGEDRVPHPSRAFRERVGVLDRSQIPLRRPSRGSFARMLDTQLAILKSALQQLGPGGRLVYSSCSLEREENQSIVERAVSTTPNVRVIDMRDQLESLHRSGDLTCPDLSSLADGPYLRTIPGIHPCDGFFASIIERSESGRQV